MSSLRKQIQPAGQAVQHAGGIMRFAVQPLSSAAVPRVTSTQIVCGDCAGLGLLPVKTFLTSVYTCSRCDGKSYVLASKLPKAADLSGENLGKGFDS
jgi:hypothetical protein